MMRKTQLLTITLILACWICSSVRGAKPTIPAAEWPGYRRDGGLTGFSPLVGGLSKQPKQLWTANLGGQRQNTERVQMLDVNGDGHKELLRVLADRLICQTISGRKIWATQKLPKLRIIQIRDFAGDGSRGIFVVASTGVDYRRYMVSGKTGRVTLLFTSRNVFGLYERFGKILPKVRGQQLCAWWSGDPVSKFGGSAMRGVGYLWSFENGLEKPNRRFHVNEVGMIYAPLHLFADMNADGKQDMVMISHEQVWVYDLESGKKIAEASWGSRIRTYWANTAAVTLEKGQRPSLLMINPMIPGVQVVDQRGKRFVRRWKRVIGGIENQYQAKVQINKGAPDPFVDLDGDGDLEILVSVTNEHKDERTNLVIFTANDGRRIYDMPNTEVLTVDELDGKSPPEIIIKSSQGKLRICNWDGKTFVDRWSSQGVRALIQPAPAEGKLSRAVGSRSSGRNMSLQRSAKNKKQFLLQFPDGVFACQLGKKTLTRLSKEIPAKTKRPDPTRFRWLGQKLEINENGKWRTTFRLPQRQVYAAEPPLVGRLAGQPRVIVREHNGAIVSLSPTGENRQVLIEKTPHFKGAALTDLDGDGKAELLALAMDKKGRTSIVAVDGHGKRRLTIESPPKTTETLLGPTGRTTSQPGRWIVARYRNSFRKVSVVAYHGRTGKKLWERDYLGPKRIPSTLFVLHLPTAVLDLDGDGGDDLIASSENWYEVIDVSKNRSLTPNRVITTVVPGHWGAYATPIVVDLFGKGDPLVFHNNAYALNLLTKPNGTPVWHYGLTRDTTNANKVGVADLDGDGTIELVTTEQDGLLRAFDARAANAKCPKCPKNTPLAAHNHGGHVRWTFRLPGKVSDFASADLDGDGRVELLCGSGDRLYALEEVKGRCQIKWSVPFGSTVLSPILADLNGDKKPEVLVTTSDGRLHCLGRQAEKK